MLKALMQETRGTPTVSPASADPPPVSTGKSRYITRKVRVTKLISSGSAVITVDDVKAQSSTAPFKILALSGWAVGCGSGVFTLGEGTWDNDTTTLVQYTDIAPLTRLPGAKFNIPDNLATMLNTGTVAIMSFTTAGSVLAAAQLCVDATIRYQI
jgi:hypothetical protein